MTERRLAEAVSFIRIDSGGQDFSCLLELTQVYSMRWCGLDVHFEKGANTQRSRFDVSFGAFRATGLWLVPMRYSPSTTQIGPTTPHRSDASTARRGCP